MIVSAVVHMLSTLLLKAYRSPRELTWVTGCVSLALILGFVFSGYLLPWNELAVAAIAVGTEPIRSVPLVGEWAWQVILGGSGVSIATLYRFFALHVIGGAIIMAFVAVAAARNENLHRVELIGIYWRFVDVVWIFLFPLLYIAK